MDIAELRREHFSGRLGLRFRVDRPAPADVELALVAAEPLASGTDPQSKREPFRLIFHGPMSPWYPQQILPLEAEGVGRLEIFLVPLGPRDGSMRYEAIFT